ncbi:hypothetical protein QFC21_002610 [Naganishia friedmannii]|uniref:Uncharacterized protein n=1 Tax=Naganishia friedmannii TaxID=89922 RepID=A0ACC2VXP4_9TREE|nr:hypothetical protein QFC21_002610 [Naganishia friedmannii]
MPPKRKSVKRKAPFSSTPIATTAPSPALSSAFPPSKRLKRVSTRSSSKAQTPAIASTSESATETGRRGDEPVVVESESSKSEQKQNHNDASLATGRSEPGLEQPSVLAVFEIPSISQVPQAHQPSATSSIENAQSISPDLQTGQISQPPTSAQSGHTTETIQAIPPAEDVQSPQIARILSVVQPPTFRENGSSASSTPSERTPSRRPPIFADAMKLEQSAATSQNGNAERMMDSGGNGAIQREMADAVPLTTQQQVAIDQQKAQLRDLMLKRMQQDRAQLRAQQVGTTTSSSKATSVTPIIAGQTTVPGRTISSLPFNLHNKAKIASKASLSPTATTSIIPLVDLPNAAEATAKRERQAKKEVLLQRLKEIEKEITILAEQEAQASRRTVTNGNGTSPNLAECHAQPSVLQPSEQKAKQESPTSHTSIPADPLTAAGWTSQVPLDEAGSSAMARAETFKQLLEQHRMEISLGLRKDSPYFPARQGVATKVEGPSAGNAVSSALVPGAPSTMSLLFQQTLLGALSPYHHMPLFTYPPGNKNAGPSSAGASDPTSTTSSSAQIVSLPLYGQDSASVPQTSMLLAELARLTSSVAPSPAGPSSATGLGSIAPYPPHTTAFGQYNIPLPAALPHPSSSIPAGDPFSGLHEDIAKNEPLYSPPDSTAIPGRSVYNTQPYSLVANSSIIKPETPAVADPSLEPLDKGKGNATSPTKAKSGRAPKKSAGPAEKRLAKKRNKCPVAVADRAERVKEQRMFMIHRERDLVNLKETCSVLGSTGDVYTVEFGQVPSCTCPDYFKGNQCKHIIFVALKVMRISETSELWYQKAYLRSEIEEIFANAPVNQFNSAQASASVQKAFRKHMGLEPTSAEEDSDKAAADDLRDDEGKRKPVEGDECPICADEMADGGQGANELVYDLGAGGCGKSLHKQCFQMWAVQESKQGKKATCVYCRHAWADTAAGGKGKGKSLDMAEGYMNMADLAGISKRRDTSTYYHGPIKGKKRWEARYGEDEDW